MNHNKKNNMKKSILLSLFLICNFVKGQDTLITDSFNRTTLGSDWVNNGLTVTLDGSDMSLSNGSAQTKYVKYISWGTCLENWQLICNFKIGSQNAAAQGLGIGIKTNSAFGNKSILCQFAHGTGASKGKTSILAGTTAPNTFSTMAVSSAQTVSLNDEIRLTVTRNKLTITAYTQNLTTGNSTTISYTFSSLQTASVFMHNTGCPYIVNAKGTQYVHDFTYTTTEPNGSNDSVNVVFLGNSITHGISVDSLHKRFSSKIMDTTNVVWEVNSGGGDYTANILSKIKELQLIRPKYCVLMIGGNDLAFGISNGTLQANYSNIVSMLKDSNITVIHCLSTPRNSVDVTSLNNWILSTYTSIDTIVDCYTPLWSGIGTGLNSIYDSGDGSHPNALGHELIGNTINNKIPYIKE